MTSNADTSVQQIQQDFQALIAYVTGPDTRAASAYTVELTLFRRLLALGAALLRVFFQTRAAERPAGPVHAPDGAPLAYHGCRPCTYYSVFGKVRFARHYFTAVGQEGVCPLDAELSLPNRCYSDVLQEWGTFGTTDESYHESQAVLARILGLEVSGAALETMAADAVADIADFHARPVRPEVRAANGPLRWPRRRWHAPRPNARSCTVRPGYYRRNAPYMRYDAYLARDWPIGTGVVEGAYGHLVKDRIEQAGMRWTKAGAQAVLDLRALRLNGQWDAYGQFHRQRQHQRLSGTSGVVAEVAEMQVLATAA